MLDTLYRRVLLPPVRLTTRNDAETAHEWFLAAMRRLEQLPQLRRRLTGSFRHDERLSQTLLGGLVFPSPFGVAAGLDKNAAILHSVEALISPGFVEIGTVTPRPQAGNPRPRIVRVGKDNLINAMGFPNDGMAAVLARLSTVERLTVPLGLNVGKMKDTPNEQTAAEYAALIRATAGLQSKQGLPDYYVINVSSPNTPGLTALQKIEPLTEIVNAVVAELDSIPGSNVPLRSRLLVKLSADIDEAELEPVVELVGSSGTGGLILTNTTGTRPASSRHDDRPGGFSGSALYDRSSRLVRHAAALLPSDRVLVATGGIDTVDRAYEMLRYADLVGGYTGLVLKGPRLFRELSEGVARRMEAAGISNLAELREGQRPPPN